MGAPSTMISAGRNSGALTGGDMREARRLEGALAGGEVRAGEMGQRRGREVAIAEQAAGLAQPFDDGGGNLAASGMGRNAGVDVQKFHG